MSDETSVAGRQASVTGDVGRDTGNGTGARRDVARFGRRVATAYLTRQLAKACITIFLVATATFFLIRLAPGNPVDTYVDNLMAREGLSYPQARQRAATLFSYDPDEPVVRQYLDYVGNLAHGDFGESIISKTPVTTLIGRYLPWTLFSVGTALMLSFIVGVLLGMLAAYRRNTWIDHLISGISSIVTAIPQYLAALILLIYLGVQWRWISITDMRGTLSPGVETELSWTFVKDALYHASLPIATYVLTTAGGWMLTMRSSTEAALGDEYVTVARARGLSERRIATGYVGRNAALPLFTQLAVSIAFVVGGSILIERLFLYQGLGSILATSIAQRDYPVMQGVFLFMASVVIVTNLMAELLYARLDPRVSVPGRR